MARNASRRFHDKVAFITGAARGIGAAVALELAREGASIVACDLSVDALASLDAALAELGAPRLMIALDARQSSSIDRAVAAAVAKFDRIDCAIPCAGVARAAPAEAMDDTTWNSVIDVNLSSAFFTCRAVGLVMLTQGAGAIVNIASITAKGGQPGRANYAASKWGLAGLTKTLALEWGSRGVRVNAVAPNGVDTPMIRDGLPPQFLRDVMLDRTPLGRLARPEEVAAAVAFLLSDDASYINGAMLEVDGGLTAGYMTHRFGADLARRDADREG